MARKRWSALGLAGALATTAFAAGGTGAPPQARPMERTAAVARDVVAGGTGVWLLSQLTLVRGPSTGPTLTALGARIERIEPATGRTLTRIDVPVAPTALVSGPSGELWITGTRLAVVDRTAAHARIVGRTCDRLVAAGPPGVWSAGCARLAAWSPSGVAGRTGAASGGTARALTLGPAGLFVSVSGASRSLERRDPSSGALMRRVTVRRAPDELVLRDGSLWALDQTAGILERRDPVTLRTTSRTRLPFRGVGGSHLAVGGGAVWVIDQHGGRIARIDRHTGRVRTGRPAPVPRDTLPVAVATGPRAVWVVMQRDGTGSALCRLDPSDGAVQRCFVHSR